MKPKIVFFGTPDFVVPVLEALIKNFQVVGVVTTPDQKVGRKQEITPSPIKQYAKKNNIPVFTDLKSSFVNLKSDLFVVAAYGKILPQKVLEIPKFGALNIHPSLLPKYRGPSPIQETLLNGDPVSGVTIIQMDERMDHGPIVFTSEISLSDKETFETLSKKMFEQGSKDLVSIIPDFIAGKTQNIPQDEIKATFTKIITKEDGYFDINPPAGGPPTLEKLDKMIRAYYPWPNAWTKWNNKIVKFYPGGLVQMEGKNPTKLEDFLRGYPDFPIKEL